MRRLGYAVGYYLFLLVFGVGAWCLNRSVALADALNRPVDPPHFRKRLRRLMAWYVRQLHSLCGLRVVYADWPDDWSERLQGNLVVANHPSLLDAPLFLARSSQFICLYKAALENSLLHAGTARRAGFLSNEGGIDAVREAVSQLEAGATLLLFPEGTRTRRTGLGPFVTGGALIANRARCPVQTMHISISCSLLAKDGPFWKPPPTPIDLVVRWGETLRCEQGETIRAFNRRLETYFREAPETVVS